ncbi:MAG: amino acid ABC transporter permease [Oscillospiraceae bacterium]|nr:amino acid ABC transporter permease [Oscillospiraceae bacterium]
MLGRIVVVFNGYWSLYLGQGLGITLGLSAITVLFGAVFGSLLAFMKMSKIPPLRWIATAYIEVIRGTPMLIQLFFFYFILPNDMIMAVFGWIYRIILLFNAEAVKADFIKFICIAIALVVNSSAYVSEVIRSGIQAVDRGQTEASRSLGLNGVQTMTKIILPQAVKNILPALGNEFVTVIKETSLASTFFIGDLMSVYNVVRGKTYLVIEPLLITAAIYFVVTFILSKLIAAWERRLKRGE